MLLLEKELDKKADKHIKKLELKLLEFYDFLINEYDIGESQKKININKLIKKLIQNDQELKFILSNKIEEKQFWMKYHPKFINKIAIFENNKIRNILLIRNIRTSYKNTKTIQTLYNISFRENDAPKVYVYKLIDDEIKLINTSQMKEYSKTEYLTTYDCFGGTPLEISLKMFNLDNQLIFQVQDRYYHILIAFAAAELIQDPIIQFRSFLTILLNQRTNTFAHIRTAAEFHIQLLIQKLSQLQNDDKIIQIMNSDPLALTSLIHYRNSAFDEDYDPDNKTLIEKIINKNFDFINKCEFLSDYSAVFLLKNKHYNNKTLHLTKYINTKNLLKEINIIFDNFYTLKKKHRETTQNIIEIILEKPDVPDLPEYLEKTLTKSRFVDTDLDIKHILFITRDNKSLDYFTFKRQQNGSFTELTNIRHLYPRFCALINIDQLDKFNLKIEPYSPHNSLFYVNSIKDKEDKRLFGVSFVYFPQTTHSALNTYPEDLNLAESLEKLMDRMKVSLEKFSQPKKRPIWNQIYIKILPILNTNQKEIVKFVSKAIEEHIENIHQLNIHKICFQVKIHNSKAKNEYDIFIIELTDGDFTSITIEPYDHRTFEVIKPLTPSEVRELKIKTKGGHWAYKIPDMLNSAAAKFRKIDLESPSSQLSEENFTELDLDPTTIVIDAKTGTIDYNCGELIPVSRAPGLNEAGVVIGIKTDDLNIGIPVKRMLIIGDITHSSQGAISAQECTRINAAIRYAASKKLPIDWISASYGVEIKMEKGVESLDASSSTIREIVKQCHHHHLQINLIIDEINIGAQSYWDTLATILHETSGILIMTPRGSMALTGHSALTSALYNTAHSLDIPELADKLYQKGIKSLSSYELIHGPNSDAMAFAQDLEEAFMMLFRHHYYSYLKPDERIVSKRQKEGAEKPKNSAKTEKEIKELKNFLKGCKADREYLIDSLRDKNPPPLKFWKDAKGVRKQSIQKGDLPQEPSTIVQEMLIDGLPAMAIFAPIGPLTPTDSEIIGRAIYKANKRLPVLILGSLTGFSCDPLSMENHQLKAGALIAKAIVEHEGPILIVNLGYLVGGTFVIFSKQLNPFLKIIAIEGSHVQVIGGKTAAKIVFHSRICKQAEQDSRLLKITKQLKSSQNDNEGTQKVEDAAYNLLRRQIIEELENQEGLLFDKVHSVERALKVGAIDAVVPIDCWKEFIINYLKSGRNEYLSI